MNKSKGYKVRITETLEKVVTIQAETEKEALQLADDNYRAAQDDYVLDAENFTNVDFKVLKDD
ncbi:MAG: DpnD/PcfM family protein [Treponema sp.]|nr:DpnD/PcfM family protein [bacterium]MBQ6056337.1 DpnD/PcfM family protein [Treponema sp.]